MAINGPNISIEQGGIGGGSTINLGEKISIDINNILYFKDIIPSYKESDCVDQTNTERLKELLLSWGFSNVIVSEVVLWKIATQYSDGPRLEWKGNLYVQSVGLHYLKCKNKDKSSYQGCYDLYSSGYVLLNTHANDNVGWKWIYISELGFAMDSKFGYQNEDIPLPYAKLSSSDMKYYTNKDLLWNVLNEEEYFERAYKFNIPNYFISNQMLEGSSWHKNTINNNGFTFDKNVIYPYDSSKEAKNFYFQEYVYLLFNNFNTTFEKGSTNTNAFTIEQSDTSISINYMHYSKTIEKTPGDKVILFIRYPAKIRNTNNKYKWNYYCYANREWRISWKKDFDVNYENGTIPANEPNHSFEGSTSVSILEVPNGTYVFKGETTPDISSWNKINNSEIKSFIKTKSYKKEEKISSAALDKDIYNTALWSSGPSISYRAQNPFSADASSGGAYLNYSEEQTKHVFNLSYETFIWNDDATFSWNKECNTSYSWASHAGDNNHFWLSSYMVWRCVVDEIGLVSWGYTKEPTNILKYDAPDSNVNMYSTPIGNFNYHNTNFYCIDTETQSTYTELSYETKEKPNVRGAFTHGLLINTSNTNHVNSNIVEYGPQNGYTNEPAIAIILMSNNPNVAGLSKFNRRY